MSVASEIPASVARRWPGAATVPLFATALFVSAFLLFGVQPMFAKMVLPALGGAPSVWSVAMVFFQAMLLAGYAYAHLLTRWLAPGVAVAVHVGLMAVVAFVALPIALSPLAGAPPAEGTQALWVLSVFALSTGLPFFAVAANAPLLQAWFARTSGTAGSNPYVLYGASNLGSFVALLAYPLVAEPNLTLAAQSDLWSRGFVLLAALVLAAGLMLIRGGGAFQPAPAPSVAAIPVRWADRARWIALAFVPSAYLVAVTAHITTDLAAAPFLWVLPLSLFLLTFVVVFRDGMDGLHRRLCAALPFAAVLLLSVSGLGSLLPAPIWLTLLLHLGVFFVAALVAHGTLYRCRPAAGELTGFYLWMSFGGVLGGIFAGLIAPNVFSSVVEYPVLVIAALLCAGTLATDPTRRDLMLLGAPLAVAAAFALAVGAGLVPVAAMGALYLALSAALLPALAARRTVALFAGLVGAVLIGRGAILSSMDASVSVRSFFGVHRVSETPDGRYRMLSHGTTVHGVERVRAADGSPLTARPEPAAYYGAGSPFAQAFDAIRAVHAGRIGRVGVVGLGMGALSCRAAPGESWRFYEIDPEVARIARDARLFRSLTACIGPDADVVLGDARLTLARTPGQYDLLVFDAFTSDAIPVHLLTREAFAGYLTKLAPGGAILFHISNRHMDLAEVAARVAAEHGLVTYLGERRVERDISGANDFQAPTRLLAMARDAAPLGTLTAHPAWRRVPADMSARPWTDDFSNILDPIWRSYTGRTFRAVP